MGGPTKFGGAKVVGLTSKQEMPPPGGYPKVKSARYLPNRGPSGAALWLGSAFVVGVGFYMTGQENLRRNADKLEKRAARLSLYPFLQAEEDLKFLEREKSLLEEEADLMKGKKGWVVGDTIWNRKGVWTPPTNGV
ncbi:hypothetical protein TrCOL_g6773 [Triparma columacea]|uniref:NADH dehydrogenase [ubiquinone] 1 alpha subcomplex subunit 13 n=1 Tax=Triparma columacea TaxID=722753 RepID=A0A9W7G4V4_9STRA|nr:hypothetical protein TrCOL_g6773 [Triparma columacea]